MAQKEPNLNQCQMSELELAMANTADTISKFKRGRVLSLNGDKNCIFKCRFH